MAWVAVVAVAVLSFVAIGAAGRLPGVDLPQHGIILRRFLEGGGEFWRIDWATPYVGWFVIGCGFAQFMEPMEAIWWAASFAIALLPIASASLAHALGRSPALGLFSLLGAFSVLTSWGFLSLVFGASTVGFALACAVAFARRPTVARGGFLAVAFAATYWAHILAWVVALPAVWFVVVLRLRTRRPLYMAPLFLSTTVTLLAFDAWNSARVVPELMQSNFALQDAGPSVLERLWQLPQTAAAFGRDDSLIVPWSLLGILLLGCLGFGAAHAYRVVSRARRVRCGISLGFWSWLRKGALACIWFASVLCFLFAPEWMSGTFLVYPRFLLVACVLLPAVVIEGRCAVVRSLALFAAVPACWLALAAGAEVRHNDERTACVDTLSASARSGESLVNLNWAPQPTGYSIPVDLHVGVEIVVRRGGDVDFDFADLGASPIVYRPGLTRTVVPSNDALPSAYRHRRHGGEFTAWFMNAPAVPPAYFFEGQRYRVAACGRMLLFYDDTVAAGSRRGLKYRPHRRLEPATGVPPVPQRP